MTRFPCWSILACLLGGNTITAQPVFFRRDIPADRPDGVIIADFNGDSRPDMAVGVWEGISILLNAGDGDFGDPIHVDRAKFPQLAADLDGDGKVDLIGIATGPFPTTSILLGRGDGTFQAPREVVSTPHNAATGDFNRDGKPDLVLYNVSTGATYLALGNGDGTFQSVTFIGRALSDQDVLTIAVEDFNRDGRSDLALFDGWNFGIFLGQGDGTFHPPIGGYVGRMPGSSTHYSSSGILFADFNRDGLVDIAARSNVMLGNGDGTFQPPLFFLDASTAKSTYPHPSGAADLNGDGHLDLVITGGFFAPISVFLGKGDGTMFPSAEYEPGGAVVTADLNGDGRPDLVSANRPSNGVSLLLNRSLKGPALNRAVSAASRSTNVASESLAILFVSTGATATEQAWPPWPTRLGGIGLEIRDSAGAVRLAPLLYVSSTQINFQVPAGVALGEASLAVVNDLGSTIAGGMQVNAVAPGLFMVSQPAFQPGTPAATAVRVAADGSRANVPVFSCSRLVAEQPEASSCRPEPIRLSGDPIYVSFYGTGFRGAISSRVTAMINNVPVPVTYAGPQGTPGLDQINIRLLPELQQSGSLGNIDGVYQRFGYVTLSLDGVVANSVLIAFTCAAGISNC